MKIACLIFFIGTLQLSGSYKILAVFPPPSKSHYILGIGVVKQLLNAGHEVTFVTPFPEKDPPPRLHQIDLSDLLVEDLADSMANFTAILNNEVLNTSQAFSLVEFVYLLNVRVLGNPNFAKFLSDTSQKFDVVIAEWLFTDVFAGLGTLFDCPLIWFSSIEAHWKILELVDEPTNPAYVPSAFSNKVPPFRFIERVQELVSMVFMATVNAWYYNKYEKSLYESTIGPYIEQRGRRVPSFDKVRYNASLVLGNSHVSYGSAYKLPQNYKPIGGYHIDSEVKPLPDNFKNLLDSANNGVIYFSMGSICRSKDIPEVLKKGILKLFSELKQTVIWKFEEALPDLPKNVHIVNWAPQQSILAHPNCILFITHGGMLSTTETIHFGKPIIGIPVFGDQFINIDRAVKKGYAIRVDLSYDMIGKLEKAIDEMLNNPRYTEVAKQLSAIYHDRPVSPGAELVHWVEHVVRTRGASYLRSPAFDVPFYQKLYLDLAAVILAIIFVLKMLIKQLCSPAKKLNKTKKE